MRSTANCYAEENKISFDAPVNITVIKPDPRIAYLKNKKTLPRMLSDRYPTDDSFSVLDPYQLDLSDLKTSDEADEKIKKIRIKQSVVYEKDGEKVIALPLCGSTYFAGPESLLRLCIFKVGLIGNTLYTEDNRFSCGEIVNKDRSFQCLVEYIGLEVDQSDLDLWLALVNFGRDNINKEINISMHNLLAKKSNKAKGGAQYKSLAESLNRLQSGKVLLRLNDGKNTPFRNSGLTISLIKKYNIDEKNQLTVVLDQNLAKLFSAKVFFGWTRIDIQQRQDLRSSLSKWLHTYYSTHRKTIPISVTTLHLLSGQNSISSKFKHELKVAIEKLKEIGFFGEKTEIKGNRLNVYKCESKRSVESFEAQDRCEDDRAGLVKWTRMIESIRQDGVGDTVAKLRLR